MQHPHRGIQRLSGFLSSCRPASCRKIGLGGSAPGQVQGGLPLDAIGDNMQQSLAVGHVVRVAGLDRFPAVPGRVGCRKPERAGYQARRLRRRGPGASAFPLALAAPVGARRAAPQEPGRSTRPSSRTRRCPVAIIQATMGADDYPAWHG